MEPNKISLDIFYTQKRSLLDVTLNLFCLVWRDIILEILSLKLHNHTWFISRTCRLVVIYP